MSQAMPVTDRGRGESFTAWLMGAPAFLGLFVFLLVPFMLAAVLSFTNQRLLSPNPTEFVNLRNYDRLLAIRVIGIEPLIDEETGEKLRDEDGNIEYPRSRTILRAEEKYDGFSEWFTVDAFGKRHIIAAKDPTFYRSLINNFIFAIIVVPLQSSLALLLAMLINQDIPGINLFRTIYFSPVVTSMVVISVVWVFLYSENGLINQFVHVLSFGTLGPIDWLNDPQSAMIAIIIMSIWQGVGFQMVIFLAGLQGIPESLYEAASIDGAGTLRRFWNVTIPQLRNTIVFVAISTTILAFRLFTQVDVMTSGGPRDSTTTVIFHAVEQGFRRQNIGYGSSISVVFFLIVLGIALMQRRVLRSSEVV
jgi:multiple sugar transport system permease protein